MATGRLPPCRRRCARPAPSCSPSATRAATGPVNWPLRGGSARSASAASSIGVEPKARASRMRQPRGRPSAASTASKIAWSPSVTVSGRARQRQRQQRMRVGDRAGIGVGDVAVAEILDAGLEELVAALAALAEHLAEIGIAARRAGLAGDVVEADGNGEFRPQAEALRRSRSRSGRCGGADPRRPCRGTGRPAAAPATSTACGAARRRRGWRCRRRWRGAGGASCYGAMPPSLRRQLRTPEGRRSAASRQPALRTPPPPRRRCPQAEGVRHLPLTCPVLPPARPGSSAPRRPGRSPATVTCAGRAARHSALSVISADMLRALDQVLDLHLALGALVAALDDDDRAAAPVGIFHLRLHAGAAEIHLGADAGVAKLRHHLLVAAEAFRVLVHDQHDDGRDRHRTCRACRGSSAPSSGARRRSKSRSPAPARRGSATPVRHNGHRRRPSRSARSCRPRWGFRPEARLRRPGRCSIRGRARRRGRS